MQTSSPRCCSFQLSGSGLPGVAEIHRGRGRHRWGICLSNSGSHLLQLFDTSLAALWHSADWMKNLSEFLQFSSISLGFTYQICSITPVRHDQTSSYIIKPVGMTVLWPHFSKPTRGHFSVRCSSCSPRWGGIAHRAALLFFFRDEVPPG